MKVKRIAIFLIGIILTLTLILAPVNHKNAASAAYNPFEVEITKATNLYTKTGPNLYRNKYIGVGRSFDPLKWSGAYYVIRPYKTYYYIPRNDAKLKMNAIYLSNLQSKEYHRLVSEYFTNSSVGEHPYLYNKYNKEDLKRYADAAITGKWKLLAYPYDVNVPDLSSFDWRSNLPYYNSYLFQLNYLMVVEQLTQAYQEFGNEEYLKYAKEIIESWYKNFPLKGYKSYKWGYNDHGTALRSFILINFWNVYKHTSLNTDTLFVNDLMKLFYEHGWLLSQESFYRPKNNHGMFQDLALLAISETFPEFGSSASYKKTALTRLMKQIEHGITVEGLHQEHSPSYQLYIYDSLINFVIWADKNQFVLPAEMIRRIKEMPKQLTYLTKPNGTLPLFGDSQASVMTPSLVVNADSYPEMIYSFTKGKSGIVPEKKALNLSNQFAVFRQHWGESEPFEQSVFFGMTAGYHSKAHKHPDDLSIELYGFGGDYIVETGRYAYLAGTERSTAMKTEAHNVVHVEGQEYVLNTETIGKSRIENVTIHQDGTMEAVGSHELISGLKSKRKVLYDQEQTFLIIDAANSSYTNNYIQRFHLAPDFRVIQSDVRKTIATHPTGRTLTMLQIYGAHQIDSAVGESHVAYKDFEWVKRSELRYKQKNRQGRYMTLIHLGKNSEDTILNSKVAREGEDYVVTYTTSLDNETKSFRFPASWK
ncbi:heparinase II/III family protein [Cytobacillus firmus]|uniref:heparinase II/III family protein n=1 Tax=Cytobacillus firmus TaxID=1399 RepID=UPI00384C996D